MNKQGPNPSLVAVAAALVVLATTGTGFAATTASSTTSAGMEAQHALSPAVQQQGRIELAEAPCGEHGEHHELQGPCEHQGSWDHHESHRRGGYNDEYIFGLTRGVADSTMHPAVKILVFPVTVPLDFALLPFEVIGGFFES